MNENKYTNISYKPLGTLDGIAIRPCMKSGFCCTKSPCAYGEFNETKSACKYLSEPNDIGQRDCLRYEWIIKNVPSYKTYPAFGAGCCMPMFNDMRENIIKKIKENEISNK